MPADEHRLIREQLWASVIHVISTYIVCFHRSIRALTNLCHHHVLCLWMLLSYGQALVRMRKSHSLNVNKFSAAVARPTQSVVRWPACLLWAQNHRENLINAYTVHHHGNVTRHLQVIGCTLCLWWSHLPSEGYWNRGRSPVNLFQHSVSQSHDFCATTLQPSWLTLVLAHYQQILLFSSAHHACDVQWGHNQM